MHVTYAHQASYLLSLLSELQLAAIGKVIINDQKFARGVCELTFPLLLAVIISFRFYITYRILRNTVHLSW